MSLPTTEKLPDAVAFDAVSARDAAVLMVASQSAAIAAVDAAAASIVAGAEVMANAIREGGALIYAAAGSSGLMALADACELPGTFGLSSASIQIHMAGGIPTDARMPGDTEDNSAAAGKIAQGIRANDAVIVLSASGSTPYALAVAEAAKAQGAKVIGVACNPNTPLLHLSDIAICVETPPEVIAGSTRLGAGTAQKVVLNAMSSLMAVQLGHVYQGMMVNLIADNAKLKQRAEAIVMRIAEVGQERAKSSLEAAQGNVKRAILIASGRSPSEAETLLMTHAGHLGPSLKA